MQQLEWSWCPYPAFQWTSWEAFRSTLPMLAWPIWDWGQALSVPLFFSRSTSLPPNMLLSSAWQGVTLTVTLQTYTEWLREDRPRTDVETCSVKGRRQTKSKRLRINKDESVAWEKPDKWKDCTWPSASQPHFKVQHAKPGFQSNAFLKTSTGVRRHHAPSWWSQLKATVP